jgi:ubiquinone/menaquinone biosynthesis C-methylase UbiE/uncharacterized protein YbaR (Trm112 family)
MIEKRFIQLLCCPMCHEAVVQKAKGLMCVACSRIYPVHHGIPIMVNLKKLPAHLKGQVHYFRASTKLYDTPAVVEPWQDKYQQRLDKHIRSYKKKIFVDNACGSGYMALYAARKGATVIACDLNLSGLIKLQLQAKRLGLAEHFFVVCCTAEALPIRSHIADITVSNAILEHLPNEMGAIDGLTRITKQEGIAMITVPLAYYLLNPLFWLVNYLYDRQIGHLRRYTKEMLVSRFSEWQLLGVYYTGHTMKVLKTFINMLVRVFDEEQMEQEDEKYIDVKYHASNISVLFRKKS